MCPPQLPRQVWRNPAAQLRFVEAARQVIPEHMLDAKLYLIRRPDYNVPRVGYLGSSNLTFSGLQTNQGEGMLTWLSRTPLVNSRSGLY